MDSNERWISKDPATRTGLYQHISEVPEHNRLRNYANRFQGQDTWSEYVDAEYSCSNDLSERFLLDLERRESRWKDFCNDRVEHHALCSPSHAKEYAAYLLDEYSIELSTAADYWAAIERFYRWMFHHTEYPHRYNPFVMAAVEDSTSEELWMIAIEPN